ncbi:MAG: hypothetical protein JW953_18090 [Anaerolineae bacterium]|nr:hypothetical protein [Anaerolineae bacterium]
MAESSLALHRVLCHNLFAITFIWWISPVSNHETAEPLSERELQVLQMVATGASNQQIARKLVISINTVKVHLRNIFEKLEVQSRTEATLRAIQEGWITVSDDADTSTAGVSAAKTFLRADRQPALARWQYVYLLGAFLLALATAIMPWQVKYTAGATQPYLPVIEVNENKFFPPQHTPTPTVPNINNTNHWTFQASMSTHRAGPGGVAFDEKIYAIGGIKNNDQATYLVEIYNPDTNTWLEGAPKPTGVANINGVALNEKIYIPGGCTGEGQTVTDVLEIYIPKTDEWTQGQTLPEGRCGYGLAGLDNKLYLFGGWNGQAFVDTIFVYSAATNEWTVLDSPMPQAKGFVGATVLDGKIYVVGGYDGQTEFNQTYIFEPGTGNWLERSPLNEKRGGLSLVSAANQLYAIGGGWQQPVTTSEKYDPSTDTWTTFEAPFDHQWRNAGLAVIDTQIYAFGGWNGSKGQSMDSVVSYQVLFQLFLPISVGQ